jgi:DNA-directed RNA polymerase subunit K/omega
MEEGISSVLTGKYLNECLKKYSRYELIHMISKRVNDLAQGSKPLVDSMDVSAMEVALREIAEGKIVGKRKKTREDQVAEKA